MGALAGAVLALGACGGSSTEAEPAVTAPTAPSGPTLAASQEVVDLFNQIVAGLPDPAAIDPEDPEVTAAQAEALRGSARALRAKVAAVEAHPCVEAMARERLAFVGQLTNLLQAVADGRTTDALGISEALGQTDTAAWERRRVACKAEVGYRSAGDP